MNYHVKSKRSLDRMSDEDLLFELLRLRGVEDPLALLRVEVEPKLHDMELLRNIYEAIELFRYHLEQGNDMHLLIDVDVDGLTSSAEMYLWIKHYFPHINVTFDCNEGKVHGLNEKVCSRIPDTAHLFITPDSSSSDTEWHTALYDDGLDILILDHHEFEVDQETDAVIVNCMDGSYPNQTLTGATLVYKFLSMYEELHIDKDKRGFIKTLLPLAALGAIADMSDVRELETRYLCLEGMKNFADNNLFLQAILEEQEFSMKGEVNFTTVGWFVSPLMNAVFRAGTLEDRYDLFKAICNFEEERVHIPTRKTKTNPNKEPITESLQKNVIRRAKTLKSGQDSGVKKEVKVFQDMVIEQGLEDSKVIILDVTDKIEPGHSGLIANKLSRQYMRPVLLFNGQGGSGRGYDKFPITNVNDWLTSSGYVKCEGHQGAFGLTDTDASMIEPLRQWCEEQLKDVDISPVWHVDFEFDINKLKERHIIKVAQYDHNWGGKAMEEPLFAITNVELETADIQRLGANGTLMKFDVKLNGQTITFVRSFTGMDMYKKFCCEDVKTGRGLGTSSVGNKKINATIIGKFKVNEFAGKQYPQIEIVEFETTPIVGRSGRRRGF